VEVRNLRQRFLHLYFESSRHRAISDATFSLPIWPRHFCLHYCSILRFKSLLVKAIKIDLLCYSARYSTMLVLETSVIYDYFPNFISQFHAARKSLTESQL
jgi:hypothetical protein